MTLVSPAVVQIEQSKTSPFNVFQTVAAVTGNSPGRQSTNGLRDIFEQCVSPTDLYND